jgi:hypothetical protein
MYGLRHPGDAKDLPRFISHAPTTEPAVAIRDVLVVPTTIVERDYPSEDEQPAVDPPVEIADALIPGPGGQASTAGRALLQGLCSGPEYRERSPSTYPKSQASPGSIGRPHRAQSTDPKATVDSSAFRACGLSRRSSRGGTPPTWADLA